LAAYYYSVPDKIAKKSKDDEDDDGDDDDETLQEQRLNFTSRAGLGVYKKFQKASLLYIQARQRQH